jgi:hypothetical protein
MFKFDFNLEDNEDEPSKSSKENRDFQNEEGAQENKHPPLVASTVEDLARIHMF